MNIISTKDPRLSGRHPLGRETEPEPADGQQRSSGSYLDSEAFHEFKQAVALLRDAYPEKALTHIRRAAELEKHNPYYQSYLGLAIAYAERRWGEAERLCEAALKLRRNEPQLYLNLAEVQATAGRREDAAETLSQGMIFARKDFRLQLALSRLARRRPPVFSLLSRTHFLNRKFGQWRHRLLGSHKRSR